MRRLRDVWAVLTATVRCQRCQCQYRSFELHVCPRGALYMVQGPEGVAR